MKPYTFHATPNPNSLKITSNDGTPFTDGDMVSFNAPEEAANHPLGKRFFAVPGVANVFILPQFVTLTKHPAADWEEMMPSVEDVLAKLTKDTES